LSAPRPATAPSPTAPATGIRFGRLLLTGAAGGLGRVLRPRLPALCEVLRVSDVADLGPAAAAEELQPAALEDKAAVMALLAGVEAVLHFGALSTEHAFEQILPANIVGTYHLYEAARVHGVRRIVFASSNHVTGFYTQGETIDTRVPMRPDSYYGLSKAFGENLAQFYFDRWGLETVSLRIGSCFPAPRARRSLSSWLSYDDLWRLVQAALTAPVVGHTVIYGVSDNRSSWWDNRHARHLGYVPADSSEPWRAQRESEEPHVDPRRPEARYQGGLYVNEGPFGDAG
jgi:uronate dehydrogenase